MSIRMHGEVCLCYRRDGQGIFGFRRLHAARTPHPGFEPTTEYCELLFVGCSGRCIFLAENSMQPSLYLQNRMHRTGE